MFIERLLKFLLPALLIISGSANALVLDFTGSPASQPTYLPYKDGNYQVVSWSGYPSTTDSTFYNLGKGIEMKGSDFLYINGVHGTYGTPFTLNSFDVWTNWQGEPNDPSACTVCSSVSVSFWNADNSFSYEYLFAGFSPDRAQHLVFNKDIKQVVISAGKGFSFGVSNITLNEPVPVSPVPEPSTYAMMAGGLGLMGFMARRRRKSATM